MSESSVKIKYHQEKMSLDIVEVITTSKLSILKTFQGGGSLISRQIGLILLATWDKICDVFIVLI